MPENQNNQQNIEYINQAINSLKLLYSLESMPYFIMLIDQLTKLSGELSGKTYPTSRPVVNLEYSPEHREQIDLFLLKQAFDNPQPDDEPQTGNKGGGRNGNKPKV